ncbi:hypothetical protein [Ascidiimonas aurantiaca]|uniref:hypothetical protein n=1 Tax=Ascidiimonas aurantiaca TaxID=1685432 RepID=UPI0030EE1BF8
MRKTAEKKIAEFIQLLFIYFILSLAIGAVKVYYVTGILNPEIIETAKVSGYVSLIVSSIVSMIVLLLITGICYFVIQVFDLKISTPVLLEGIKTSVIVFMIAELVKFSFVFIFLRQEIQTFTASVDIMPELKLTRWYFYDSTVKYAMLLIGTFAFGFKTYEITQGRYFFHILVLSMVLLAGFYVSTIDLFGVF